MRKLKLDDWITIQRRRKWRWAGKVAHTSREDWMAMAIRWDPILDPKLKATRRPGRPKTRWTDDICNHIGSAHDHDTNDAMRSTDEDVSTTTTPANNEKWLQMESQQHAGLEDSFAKALRTTACDCRHQCKQPQGCQHYDQQLNGLG
jgi:hypothetical protein